MHVNSVKHDIDIERLNLTIILKLIEIDEDIKLKSLLKNRVKRLNSPTAVSIPDGISFINSCCGEKSHVKSISSINNKTIILSIKCISLFNLKVISSPGTNKTYQ